MADFVPITKTNFQVEIDGLAFGNFILVSGLGGNAEVMDDIGGMDKNAKRIPGNVKYEVVQLTRNCDPKDSELREWWGSVEKGTPERKPVSIVFFDRNGTDEVARRNLYECVPCGWDMSDLGSQETGALTETISLVYEDADWA